MIHPEGVAVFVEVPKTGSTACTLHLRKHKWFQNGSQGTIPVTGAFPGRHSYPNAATRQLFDQTGVTAYGVVRNPWDRMASLWRSSAPGNTSFIDYMRRGKFTHGPIDVMTCQQRTWLEHVDHVMRYETLEQDWAAHATVPDVPDPPRPLLPPGPIAPANVSKNRAKPDWTQDEIDIVAERFALDIETYGYTGPT